MLAALVGASPARAASSTIWTQPTGYVVDSDTGSVELGTEFSAAVDARATAIRFFKTSENTGTHVGSLWTSSGTRLASVTFRSESSSGWQTATLSTPVNLAGGDSYVVSYTAPNGRYVSTTGFSGASAAPGLLAVDARNSGVYTYGTGFPTKTWNGSQYWVDVVAEPVGTSSPGTPSPRPTTPSPTPSAPSPAPTAPGASLYGTASTSGAPDGLELTRSGSLVVSTPGTVIDGRDIQGSLTINASDVTITRSRVSSSNWAVIRVADNARNVVLSDLTVTGAGRSGSTNSTGIYGPARVERVDISGVENGVSPGSGSVIRGSYIHDFGGPDAPHYDGIQIDGGQSNIVVENNTIDLQYSQTSAVMIDNYFGSVSNVAVRNNRLLGGGYTVYVDGAFSSSRPITGVIYENNRIGGWEYGPALLRNGQYSFVGNVNDVTGARL